MSDKRIAELQNFKTKNFTDCPVQTPEQLQEFKPKYPDARLYKGKYHSAQGHATVGLKSIHKINDFVDRH